MKFCVVGALALGTFATLMGGTGCSADPVAACEGAACGDPPATSDTGDVPVPDAAGATNDGGSVVDGSGGKADAGKVDSGGPAADSSAPGAGLNPYGVAYPTKGLGTTARKGTTPGGVIANLKFDGYPDGDSSKGLQSISIANFFDPQMKKFKVIVVAGTANWCPHCQKEAQEVVSGIAQFNSEKIGFINAVMESKTGQPSTKTDLDSWVTTYKVNFTAVLDPAGKNLGPYGLTGYPFNVVLDARSMEILAIINGRPSEGMLARAKTYASWVDTHAVTTY
jgi:thiol-disulfide isomerase/thioredoxin